MSYSSWVEQYRQMDTFVSSLEDRAAAAGLRDYYLQNLQVANKALQSVYALLSTWNDPKTYCMLRQGNDFVLAQYAGVKSGCVQGFSDGFYEAELGRQNSMFQSATTPMENDSRLAPQSSLLSKVFNPVKTVSQWFEEEEDPGSQGRLKPELSSATQGFVAAVKRSGGGTVATRPNPQYITPFLPGEGDPGMLPVIGSVAGGQSTQGVCPDIAYESGPFDDPLKQACYTLYTQGDTPVAGRSIMYDTPATTVFKNAVKQNPNLVTQPQPGTVAVSGGAGTDWGAFAAAMIKAGSDAYSNVQQAMLAQTMARQAAKGQPNYMPAQVAQQGRALAMQKTSAWYTNPLYWVGGLALLTVGGFLLFRKKAT